MTATQQRAAADYLQAAYAVSQRRASTVLGRSRATLRYRRQPRCGEDALVQAIRRLARRHPCYGYKRIHARLRQQGWRVNGKRVRRLWIALGLRRPPRRPKPRKLGANLGSSVNSCVHQPARFKNDVWSYDFIADRTAEGRSLKCLSLVDEYTRECLLLHMAGSVSGAEVRRLLARVVGWRGAPTRLRSDNGSEFICEALACWLPRAGRRPSRWRRRVRGRTVSLRRSTVGCGTSFWSVRSSSRRKMRRRGRRGGVGNTTRSVRTAALVTRRRSSSAANVIAACMVSRPRTTPKEWISVDGTAISSGPKSGELTTTTGVTERRSGTAWHGLTVKKCGTVAKWRH